MMMELESALLAHLVSADAIKQCWDEGLRREVFEDPLKGRIYDFVLDYWRETAMKRAPSETVLTEEFPGFTLEPSDESLTWVIGKLKARYKANQVQNLLRTAAVMSTEDPDGALTELYMNSHHIREAVAPRMDRVIVHETIESRRDRYLARNQEVRGGATVGLAEVDEHTGGILPGELAIVAAYTKTGKSFMLVNAAVQAAVQHGKVPYIATLEQNIDEFEDRGLGTGRRRVREVDEIARQDVAVGVADHRADLVVDDGDTQDHEPWHRTVCRYLGHGSPPVADLAVAF